MSGVTLAEIHYDAQKGHFEARVDISAEGRTLHCLCAVPGSPRMAPRDVQSALIAKAHQQDPALVALRTVL